MEIGLKIGLSLTYARLVTCFYASFKSAILTPKTRAKSIKYAIFAQLCEMLKTARAKELVLKNYVISQYINQSAI